MDKAHTSQVIEQFALIPGAVSKELLRTAIGLPGRRKRSVPLSPDSQSVERLRAVYTKYKPACEGIAPAPRYLPFYLALQDLYPKLDWKTKPDRHEVPGRSQVVLGVPRIRGVLPSIAALLLQELPAHEMHMTTRMPDELFKLPSSVRDDFVELLESSHAVFPKAETLRDMAKLLTKGLAGEALVAVCPVCPDYGVEPTGDPQQPYKYTFSSLGEGVGLVAGRLLEDLPRYASFFRRHDIDVRYFGCSG